MDLYKEGCSMTPIASGVRTVAYLEMYRPKVFLSMEASCTQFELIWIPEDAAMASNGAPGAH